ncbi:MAG: hypothetical protein V1722_01685 [Candidatus Micrarchaeota archaeon]
MARLFKGFKERPGGLSSVSLGDVVGLLPGGGVAKVAYRVLSGQPRSEDVYRGVAHNALRRIAVDSVVSPSRPRFPFSANLRPVESRTVAEPRKIADYIAARRAKMQAVGRVAVSLRPKPLRPIHVRAPNVFLSVRPTVRQKRVA